MPYVSKWPKWCQPDLDFMAPEIQLESASHNTTQPTRSSALHLTGIPETSGRNLLERSRQAAATSMTPMNPGLGGGFGAILSNVVGGGAGVAGGSGGRQAADIFSLGLLICALHNDGKSLIDCNSEAEFYEASLGQVYMSVFVSRCL